MTKKDSQKTGFLAMLTAERSMSKEFEAAGLLVFLLFFILGPLSVSAGSAGNIIDSYKVSYEKTVDGLSDLLLDASEAQDSYVAAVIRSNIGVGRFGPQIGSSTPRQERGDMGEHASTTPRDWNGQGGGMGDMMLGENHEDASSTQSVTLQLSPADIKTLQQFLNKNGFNVTQTGDGSQGNETGNFGPKTGQALKKFLQFLREHSQNGNHLGNGGIGSTSPMGGVRHDDMGSTSPMYRGGMQGPRGQNVPGTQNQ